MVVTELSTGRQFGGEEREVAVSDSGRQPPSGEEQPVTVTVELAIDEAEALEPILSTHVGPWTDAEYEALPETHTRIELVDGELLVSPNATRPHHQFARRLADALERAAAGDVEICMEMNLRLGSGRYLNPDVAVALLPASNEKFTPADEVLLVAEVSSPSNAAHDRVRKHTLYADAGIPCYLRFDILGPTAPAGVAYRLGDDGYVEVGRAERGGRLELTDPFPVTLDLGSLTRRRPR